MESKIKSKYVFKKKDANTMICWWEYNEYCFKVCVQHVLFSSMALGFSLTIHLKLLNMVCVKKNSSC